MLFADKPGTKVKTTESYFQKYDRRVHGILMSRGEQYSLVKWMHQTGINIRPINQGKIILMLNSELEEE